MTENAVNDSFAPWPRRKLFGVEIDAIGMDKAIQQVWRWVGVDQRECQYIVTPNVDHVVQLQKNLSLKQAYCSAGLVVADGWPLVAASKLLGKSLPQRVPGSDLVPKLLGSVTSDKPMSFYLLGAAPGVAIKAAENIQQRWPAANIVGTYSPPMGFEKDPYECEYILERIAAAKPDVLILGLGAPKQELWIHKHQKKIQAKVALCVGATIDFLADNKRRAPMWMQKTGIEWLHRMMSEPKRLVSRYAKDAAVFPGLVIKEIVKPSTKTLPRTP